VVRGDWFVTGGDALDAIVVVTDPVGNELYREGPTRQTYVDGYEATEPASEGSFRFYLEHAGLVSVSISNPSASEPRSITLAWLKGRDDDDPFTADDSWDFASEDPHAEALIANPRNVSAYVRTMLGRASRLHKKLDELVAQQQYLDVLFKRHTRMVDMIHARVTRFALAEAAVVVVTAVLQALVIRRFDIKPASFHTWV
jgi:hypothetical protein